MGGVGAVTSSTTANAQVSLSPGRGAMYLFPMRNLSEGPAQHLLNALRQPG